MWRIVWTLCSLHGQRSHKPQEAKRQFCATVAGAGSHPGSCLFPVYLNTAQPGENYSGDGKLNPMSTTKHTKEAKYTRDYIETLCEVPVAPSVK